MTIRKKLYLIMFLSVVSIFLNIYIVNYMLSESKKLNTTKSYIYKIDSNMKMLTKDSVDFLEYKHESYNQDFQKQVALLTKEINSFENSLVANNIETKSIEKITQNLMLYSKKFTDVVEIQKTIGYTAKDGITKDLHASVRKAELFAKRMQDQDVYSMVLTLRKFEKSFLITHDKKILKSLSAHLTHLFTTYKVI